MPAYMGDIRNMKKFFLFFLLVIAAAALIIAADNRYVKLTRYTVSSAEIPAAFDGYRIIQLSDIHSAVFGSDNEELIGKIKNAGPDLILVTGDVANSVENDDAYDIFENITARLDGTAPIYAVTGNHDVSPVKFGEYISGMESKYDIRWLFDETVALERGGSEIYLSGIADPLVYDYETKAEKLRAGIEACGAGEGFNMLMYHRADMLNDLMDSGFDVVFSGHMHGGQWRIPFVGGVISPDMVLFPEYSGGIYKRGEKTFIVSCGLGNKQKFPGTDILVPRIFNMAEIVEVTLEAR